MKQECLFLGVSTSQKRFPAKKWQPFAVLAVIQKKKGKKSLLGRQNHIESMGVWYVPGIAVGVYGIIN